MVMRMQRAQFYIVSVVIALAYLLTISALMATPTPQPYDTTPQIFDNIQREIELIAKTSQDPQRELQTFDAFLQKQLGELNYDYELGHDQALRKFTLSLSSDRTKITNHFEVEK